MASQTIFVVQAFEMRRKRIVPTTKEQVKGEAQAYAKPSGRLNGRAAQLLCSSPSTAKQAS